MAFQFFCPNRHLLQANENQVGQICRCPMCQTEFLIPSPTGQPLPSPQPTPVQNPAPATPQSAQQAFSLNTTPKSNDKFTFLGDQESAPQETAGFNLEKPAEESEDSSGGQSKAGFKLADVDNDPILHSVCPNGHILEIEREMLGERAMCPYCNIAFELKLERTVEYLEKQKREAEREDNKLAKFWSQWAIVAAVLAAIFIVFMVILGMK